MEKCNGLKRVSLRDAAQLNEESTSVDVSGSSASSDDAQPILSSGLPNGIPNGISNGISALEDIQQEVRAKKKPRLSKDQREARVAAAVETILECIDDDPQREGLRKTPLRYAKVCCCPQGPHICSIFVLSGYDARRSLPALTLCAYCACRADLAYCSALCILLCSVSCKSLMLYRMV